MVICLKWGADLHIAQLMPLPLTISCSSKSRLVLPEWFCFSGAGLSRLSWKRLLNKCSSRVWKSKIESFITPFVTFTFEKCSTLIQWPCLNLWILQKLHRCRNLRVYSKVYNDDVLKRVNEERSLLKEIWQRKHRWIGHMLRHDGFPLEIFEGRMLGKMTRGRRRMQMLHDLTMNSDYITLKQTAAERTMWRYSRGISRTCSTAEDWRKEGRKDATAATCITIHTLYD